MQKILQQGERMKIIDIDQSVVSFLTV